MMPRWWTPQLEAGLEEIDRKFWSDKRSGPLSIEIHYRGGSPLLARVRDVVLAPVLVEIAIAIAATS